MEACCLMVSRAGDAFGSSKHGSSESEITETTFSLAVPEVRECQVLSPLQFRLYNDKKYSISIV